jgi:hypothetical protein
LTAAAGVRSADVRWSAPVDDVAAPVLLYVASASPGGAICLAVAPATSCTLTGLVDGTAYTVTVTASSVAGTSPASAPVTVTPVAPVAPVAPVVPVTPVVPGPAAASATSGGTPSATVSHDPAFAANWGITDLSPSSGSTEGGTDVAITGTNLPDGAIVQFGTAPATVTYASGSSLIVTAPRNVVPGPVDVTVWSPDRHYQVLSGAFSYLAPGGPPRQSSAPASAPSPAASAAPSTGASDGATATGGSGGSGAPPSTGSTSTAGPAATSAPDAGTARLAPVSADATIPDWMWRQPGCSGRCTALTV